MHDEPGILADLACKIAKAGVSLDLVYVATNNRVVFGSHDTAALEAALGRSPATDSRGSAPQRRGWSLIAVAVRRATARAAVAKSSPEEA